MTYYHYNVKLDVYDLQIFSIANTAFFLLINIRLSSLNAVG